MCDNDACWHVAPLRDTKYVDPVTASLHHPCRRHRARPPPPPARPPLHEASAPPRRGRSGLQASGHVAALACSSAADCWSEWRHDVPTVWSGGVPDTLSRRHPDGVGRRSPHAARNREHCPLCFRTARTPRSWLSHRRSGSLHLGADVPSAPDGRRLGRPFFEVIPQLPPVFARAAFVWDNHAAQTSAVTAYNSDSFRGRKVAPLLAHRTTTAFDISPDLAPLRPCPAGLFLCHVTRRGRSCLPKLICP